MFSAMILACTFNTIGSADMDQCVSMVPYLLFKSEEECMTSLQYVIMVADQRGFAVVDYQCFNWETKEGTPL
jgi:hypothetical protein